MGFTNFQNLKQSAGCNIQSQLWNQKWIIWVNFGMVALSYSIQGVHTLYRGTREWVKWISEAYNSLQAVIFNLICNIGNKFSRPILAWWPGHLAFKVFILSRMLSGWGKCTFPAPNSLQAVIFTLICKVENNRKEWAGNNSCWPGPK
jgi:hypothetical protein